MKKSRTEANRKYYAANREKVLARIKTRRASDPERFRALEAAWRKANPEKCKEKQRRYRQKPESKVKAAAKQRARRAANPEAVRAAERAFYARAVVRRRAQRRVCYAKARLLDGKVYSPRFRVRLPEWAATGKRALDARSQWLAVNLSASQRAYARELAIERRAAR
ncbi:MAG: hypothetical protein IJL17_02120 [Kiritimatiellae bacterium]|nr:hypothetical protein [Kiritimatiellia bacterium]